MRVLVIDDSKTEQLVVTKALEAEGYDVFSAYDGEDGINKATTLKPDVIILDVVMPGKNGFEVCRAIKKDEVIGKTPVILCTSKDQESDKFWGLKQGADEYITKPYKVEDLIQVVRKFMLK